MKGIPNPKFWSLWNQHKYKEALQEPLQPLKNQQTQNPMQSFLFGNAEELKQSFSIGVISTGEFLFDYFRIDPLVMEGSTSPGQKIYPPSLHTLSLRTR